MTSKITAVIEERMKEIDTSFWGLDSLIPLGEVVKKAEIYLLKSVLQALCEEIEKLKCDERFVGHFGLHEARTYNQKSLVNAAYSELQSKLKEEMDNLK